MTEKKRFRYIYNDDGSEMIQYDNGEYIMDMEDATEMLNEQEDKLKRIEKEVNNCNIYRDDLKDIILEIRCILNGDV